MSLYDGPRDVTAHLMELEGKLNPSGFDHQNSEITGWRAERQIELELEQGLETAPVDAKAGLREWLSEIAFVCQSAVRHSN